MTDWVDAAVRNNASWCDHVARTHGLPTRWDDDAWTCPVRTPAFFPDAVTLVPDVDVGALLDRTEIGVGCSVKDSFATLDLARVGFEVLFDGEWVAGPVAPAPGPTDWSPVANDDLQAWVEAAAGIADADSLPAPLFERAGTIATARRDGGRIVAGATLHHTDGVVGVGNVFDTPGASATTWTELIVLVAWLFPGTRAVGWESGDDLAGARRAGFDAIGPLRVWVRGR